ncbi:hypothetical protein RD110_10080 [Rhodoferax koreense]|uniref:Glycosyl hydrolase n=1 Tax=Rhodoferax koreensis TaxID=1842727 RepID=A0A1P8JUT1_9BURK|nr:glycoside hydrolase family 99-like domain-containing protein [Rhodoferax koreense]APW37495.1 hypothetical protein RD110_10080 [Rhodoferax koreense]
MTTIIEQYEHNTSKGPDYRPSSDLPAEGVADPAVRYIAYYLPQFHTIPENDEWWGRGFTEWSNVTKALPRYVGHYQPRLPEELGYYDLSKVDALKRQVELAKRGGIYGFCIHNYWFSGRTILDTPLNLLLENKDIDFKFCLNWANETWSRRWDGSEQHVLMKQNHAPGEDIQYAEYIAKFIRDERYIRIDGRPVIMLYRPSLVPDAKEMVQRWREYFKAQGLGDPYIMMPQAFDDNDPRKYGMDAVAGFPPHKVGKGLFNNRRRLRYLDPRFIGNVVTYDELAESGMANKAEGYTLHPGVCPSWDNDARRPNWGRGYSGSNPAKYGDWLHAASTQALQEPSKEARIVFINAWNEWAEGAYLEPDRHFGSAYLHETRKVLDQLGSKRSRKRPNHGPMEEAPASFFNFVKNLPSLGLRKLTGNFGGRNLR